MTNFLTKKILKKEDFMVNYSGLSTVELLKIINQKEKYQPAAIEAAHKILSERSYSNDELNAAQAEINLLLNKKIERQERINKKINGITGFIDEHFGIKERSPEKILNLFCAALFLYTFSSSFFNIRELAGYYYSTFTSWSIAILIYVIQLFIIYLLYIRSNWGWILIVAGCVILAIQSILTFVESFSAGEGFLDFIYEPIHPYSQALSFFINTCVILFLNRKNICRQFTITKNGRIATLLIPAGILTVFFIIQYILRNGIII